MHIQRCTSATPTHLLRVHVVKVILYELHTGGEVGLVELVGDVPTEWSELAPLLHSGVEEGHGVEHGPPLGQVGVVQLLL